MFKKNLYIFLESDRLYGYNILIHYFAIGFFELKLMRYISVPIIQVGIFPFFVIHTA